MNAVYKISPDAVRSYLSWWQDAGYVCPTVAESDGWLGNAPSDDADFDAMMAQFAISEPTRKTRPIDAHVPPPSRSDSVQDTPTLPLPETHEAFLALLADPIGMPFRGPGNRAALPVGKIESKLCIVTDMPVAVDEQTGQLMSGDEGALLRNMISAMGLSMEQVYICAFNPRYDPAASANQHGAYAALWRRHVSFLRASHILTLGDQSARLVFGKTLPEIRGRLHDINHDAGTVHGTASFHPRGLLKKPMAKRQAWHDLQFLMKEMGLS